jgi:chemotaxis protein histidine kinase CheA
MAKETKPKAKESKAKPKETKPKAKAETKPKAKETAPKRKSWFDAKSKHPLIEEYARQLDSFAQAMADGKIEDAELSDQEARLIDLMRELEPQLDDALHEKITRLLCELTAYDLMQMLHTMQQARPKTVFRG